MGGGVSPRWSAQEGGSGQGQPKRKAAQGGGGLGGQLGGLAATQQTRDFLFPLRGNGLKFL